MNDFVIELDHVWKEFPVRRESAGIKEFVLHLHKFLKGRKEEGRHFNALKDVTFGIRREECVGIIGRNGAGKSTLLSLMLGTVSPSKGEVRIADRITPLLELGAGLHPDLTGRENIVLNGVLLGLTRNEILNKIPSIIDFSEIGEFIDVPIRTYSSGMYLRLAFSIAVHADPRILLVDEVFAVGDEGFQIKSFEALLRLIRNGATAVLVSHNLQAIENICTRALWLDHGGIVLEGEPRTVTGKYRDHFHVHGH
jgi:lipopolysaccharide transport system ATP-binding protein